MFISDKELAAHLSVSRSTIWRWTSEQVDFPKPYALSAGCKRWKISEVEAWTDGAAAEGVAA